MQAKALDALRATRYKDAIDHFKVLLKGERNPEWVNNLAQAYAGRAQQLAAKDMLKEALALWRTRAQVCALPLELGPCLSWLIRLGEWEQVFAVLAGAEAISPEAREQAETELARVVLSAPEEMLSKFPPQSPLLSHRRAAFAALAAYAEGDTALMNAHLGSIPFRSPFRDLRAILKALVLLPADLDQASVVIERVPAGGPFEPLAAAVRICVLPGDQWLAPFGELDQETRALVLDIKGCPPEQRAAVTELSMLQNDPAATCDWVVRHRQVFPPGEAARLCFKLLPHVPERIKVYSANFSPLRAMEHQRILALGAELKGDFDRAESHWQRMIDAMPPDQTARAALILNHMADFHHHGGKPGELCEQGIAFLDKSVDLDDSDSGTHLRLIRALRISGGAAKLLNLRLDRAVKRFPNDVEILLEAMDGALVGGAFKKVAELAKRILELDPINTKVRNALGQAHLSQARKHLLAGNLKAALRELGEAEQWMRSDVERGALKLLQAFAAQGADQKDALLRAAAAGMGRNLPGIFHMLLEAERTQRSGAELLRLVGAKLDATPTAEDVVALANALNTVTDRNDILRGALAPLEKMIERAANLPYAESAHMMVCEAFQRRDARGLTRRYAEAALKRWPGRPPFVYLRAAAMFAGKSGRIPRKELDVLEKAWEAAELLGDERTASRLDAMLTDSDDDFDISDGAGGLPAFLNPEFADPVADIDAIFAIGGEDAFLEILRGQIGKRAFDELHQEIGGDKKRFARRLMEMFTDAQGLLGGAGKPDQGPFPTPRGAPKPAKPRPTHPGQKDFFDD